MGDELGDALQLPFVVSARTKARRTLTRVRRYARVCEHWLLGRVLVAAHRLVLRLVQVARGEERFPMLCPALRS